MSQIKTNCLEYLWIFWAGWWGRLHLAERRICHPPNCKQKKYSIISYSTCLNTFPENVAAKSHKILLTFNFRKRSAGPTHVTFEYGFLMAESSANFTWNFTLSFIKCRCTTGPALILTLYVKNRYVQIVSKKLFDFGMGKAYKKYTACAYEKIDEIADP